jgi:hypothetical protein
MTIELASLPKTHKQHHTRMSAMSGAEKCPLEQLLQALSQMDQAAIEQVLCKVLRVPSCSHHQDIKISRWIITTITCHIMTPLGVESMVAQV